MYLRKTDKHKFDSFTGTFWNKEKAYVFFEAFNVVKSSREYSSRLDVSSKHFVKILQEGKTLGLSLYKGKNNHERHLHYCQDYNAFTSFLCSCFIDHSFFWGLKSKKVIYTSIPYSDHDQIIFDFFNLAKEFSFPSTIKLAFLDEKYRYYDINFPMFMLYNETDEAEFSHIQIKEVYSWNS